MEHNSDIDEEGVNHLRLKFNNALNNCKTIFEDNLFIDTSRDRQKQGMVHYDLLMATVGLINKEIIDDKRIVIKDAYHELCSSEDFRRTLSGGLQKKTSILRRRSLWEPLLNAALEK